VLRARAVMLTNYQAVARFVGLDPLAMLRNARISAAALEDPENWLPGERILALIDESAELSGRDDFGILLGQCRTFTSIGPVSLLLKHEATVRDILLAVVEYRYLLNELLHISIVEDEVNATVEWNLVPGLQSSQGVNLVSAIAYRAISEALESSWEPDCIHFRHSTPAEVTTFRRFFQCPIEFDSSFDGVSCTAKALHAPNPFAEPDLAAYARRLLNLLPKPRSDSVVDKVRSVILLIIQDSSPTIERVADCLGVPVRTLQRKLIREGHAFSDILNEIRRELAPRYLAHSSHSLVTIAHLTGYSSLSSFSRWFAAEFNMPPMAWRKKHRDSRPRAVIHDKAA
jgi:AraC-like DNA-binding protein